MKKLIVVLVALAWGCGESGQALDVALTMSSSSRLDPFGASVGLTQVRVIVEGDLLYDETVFDVAPGAGIALRAEDLLSQTVRVRVEGYDPSGTVVALGRSRTLDIENVSSVEIPFRRNLAYITHEPVAGQDQPARSIYAIDLASRALVDEIRLPGTNPIARSVTARGGASMIVTWQDGNEGFTALLSLDDHSVGTPIRLPGVQEVTLGTPDSPRGVSLGGGRVGFVDFDAGTAEGFGRLLGGNVLDAVIDDEGRQALAAVDVSPPGLLLIDLERRSVDGQNVVPDPGGVALDTAGQVAYVASRTSRQVAAFDFRSRRARNLGGRFAASVEFAVYSEAARALFGVNREGRLGQVLAYSVANESGAPIATAIETLERPTGIAADGTGRRFIVVAAGSSTTTAGFTIIDTFVDRFQGSSRLYPGDPEDTFLVSSGSPDRDPVLGRQRYRPSSVAIAYGR